MRMKTVLFHRKTAAMNKLVIALRQTACGRLSITLALALSIAVLAACGSAAEPEQAAKAPEPTSAPAASSTQAEATEPLAPSARMAPTFGLPNARGEAVSLASYAGDKNVVLVFYRGFW